MQVLSDVRSKRGCDGLITVSRRCTQFAVLGLSHQVNGFNGLQLQDTPARCGGQLNEGGPRDSGRHKPNPVADTTF